MAARSLFEFERPRARPSEWFLAVDLGKRQDPSALAAVEYEPSGCVAVRHLERLPIGTPYTAVVQRIATLAQTAPLAGQVDVVVDAGGCGEPVLDLLRATRLGGASLVPILMVGAGTAHRDENTGCWVVPKVDVIQAVELLLERDPPGLLIAHELRLAETLLTELGGFRASLTAAGRLTYDHDAGGGHGDLAIAVALGVWCATRRPRPRISFGCF